MERARAPAHLFLLPLEEGGNKRGSRRDHPLKRLSEAWGVNCPLSKTVLAKRKLLVTMETAGYVQW